MQPAFPLQANEIGQGERAFWIPAARKIEQEHFKPCKKWGERACGGMDTVLVRKGICLCMLLACTVHIGVILVERICSKFMDWVARPALWSLGPHPNVAYLPWRVQLNELNWAEFSDFRIGCRISAFRSTGIFRAIPQKCDTNSNLASSLPCQI